jgi:hypothetical protein
MVKLSKYIKITSTNIDSGYNYNGSEILINTEYITEIKCSNNLGVQNNKTLDNR